MNGALQLSQRLAMLTRTQAARAWYHMQRTFPSCVDFFVVAVGRPPPWHRGAGEPQVRILVADVLEQVANGIAWEAIVDDWRGDVSKEAIAEAVRLAREVLLAHEQGLVAG